MCKPYSTTWFRTEPLGSPGMWSSYSINSLSGSLTHTCMLWITFQWCTFVTSTFIKPSCVCIYIYSVLHWYVHHIIYALQSNHAMYFKVHPCKWISYWHEHASIVWDCHRICWHVYNRIVTFSTGIYLCYYYTFSHTSSTLFHFIARQECYYRSRYQFSVYYCFNELLIWRNLFKELEIHHHSFPQKCIFYVKHNKSNAKYKVQFQPSTKYFEMLRRTR